MKKEDKRCFVIDGTKLKNKRREAGLTQVKLAEILGIDVSTLRKNEHEGPHNMFVSTVTAIATVLHCPPNDLFYEDSNLSSFSSEPISAKAISVFEPEETDSDTLESMKKQLLTLSPYADEPLKMASAGLLNAEGSKERVSVAIASISGYMRSIIWRAPGLKNHMQRLVEAIIPALSVSELDEESTIMNLRTGLRNNMAELSDIENLPTHARTEGSIITDLLVRSQMTNDANEQLRAIKASMYWLRDYWQFVCHTQAAYYAWSDVCCMLTGAPVDYDTRANITASVNELALYVSLLDPLYAMTH